MIRVRVNDELMLDAGACEVSHGHRRIFPPETSLFRQVLVYLRAKPTPSQQHRGADIEGLAAASVTLRWGSYLAVLADNDKAVSAEPLPGVSRISDGEMARINIEASAALAEWIDLSRSADGWCKYLELVARAVAYLPIKVEPVKPKAGPLTVLAEPKNARRLIAGSDGALLAQVRADAMR